MPNPIINHTNLVRSHDKCLLDCLVKKLERYGLKEHEICPDPNNDDEMIVVVPTDPITAQALWKTLDAVAVNSDEEIEEQWFMFESGTSVYDIWRWIEDTFNVAVHDL